MTDSLKPCPFCGGNVRFHADENCDGCHYIECQGCSAFFDFSITADPMNSSDTIEELRTKIAPKWNSRAETEPK